MDKNVGEESGFTELVAEIFRRIGSQDVSIDYVYAGSYDHDYEIDILFGVKGDATIVEVKHYRYRSPPTLDLLTRAMSRIRDIQKMSGAEHAMLVMSCPLTPRLAGIAKQFPEVQVWDAFKLFQIASAFPDVLKELEQFLEVTAAEILGVGGNEAVNVESSKVPSGKALADHLSNVPPGRSSAYDFEDACINALRYLFDSDLVGWHEQIETDDGLQRRDLVCRILPNSEVWQLGLPSLSRTLPLGAF
ncbi:restriction endonuclease [Herbaspirillum seropedicae]|uniref:restriction endonuclease n=1 Tax=Herbaspirillum seropedicae TaxID=964 RepID=UPI003F8D5234